MFKVKMNKLSEIYFTISSAAMISRVCLHKGDQSFRDTKPLFYSIVQVTSQSIIWPYYLINNITKGIILYPTSNK